MFHATRTCSHTSEIVLQAFDVVLADVRTPLDFDDDHVSPADVLDPVDGSQRYVEGMARFHPDCLPVPGNEGLAPHEMPVLGSVFVSLQAHAFSRTNEEPLYFAAILFV
jgi:rhodanese-related sulfurtransferase